MREAIVSKSACHTRPGTFHFPRHSNISPSSALIPHWFFLRVFACGRPIGCQGKYDGHVGLHFRFPNLSKVKSPTLLKVLSLLLTPTASTEHAEASAALNFPPLTPGMFSGTRPFIDSPFPARIVPTQRRPAFPSGSLDGTPIESF